MVHNERPHKKFSCCGIVWPCTTTNYGNIRRSRSWFCIWIINGRKDYEQVHRQGTSFSGNNYDSMKLYFSKIVQVPSRVIRRNLVFRNRFEQNKANICLDIYIELHQNGEWNGYALVLFLLSAMSCPIHFNFPAQPPWLKGVL